MRRRWHVYARGLVWALLGFCIGELTWLLIDEPSLSEIKMHAESSVSRLPDRGR